MTRSIQSLLKLSMTIRTLSSVKNPGLSLRLIHSSSVLDRRFNRTPALENVAVELPQFSLPEKLSEPSEEPEEPTTHGKGNFYYKIKEARTPNDLFEIIRTRSDELNGFKSLKCLGHLYDMEKSAKDQNTEKSFVITNKKEFALICDCLKKNIRQLTLPQTIDALKYFTFLGVSSTTVIVQMLLQLIREQVNHLSPDQIMFLNYVLKKCQRTPLVEALHIALPIVFETHIGTKLNTDNIHSLINTLQFLKQSDMPSGIIPKILRILEKKTDFTPEQAKQILFCLVDLNEVDNLKDLLKIMSEVCAGDMNVFTPDELHVIIIKLSKKLSLKTRTNPIFYNEAFVDAAAMTIISRDLGFSAAVHLVDYMNEVEHINISLLDYIAAKCFEEKNNLRNANKHDISNLIYSLSQADYKPVFWDSMKESLKNEKCLEDNPMKLIKLAIYLATLDCYWPQLFGHVFSRFKILSDKSFNSKKRLLLLYHTVKNNYPEFNGPWPSEEVLETCKDISMPEKNGYPLKFALETVLGGPQFTITNVKTKLSYYIDHVVVMRKGGDPVAINNPEDNVPKEIEELNLPPDCQALLFMHLPKYAYPRNVKRLTGYWSLIVKQLELETKHTIIPINAAEWSSMMEQEQIKYISQAIKLKCDERSAFVN